MRIFDATEVPIWRSDVALGNRLQVMLLTMNTVPSLGVYAN